MKGLVSICIPTYKQTFLLAQSLDSIYRQTYKDIEVLVSDDSPGFEVRDLVKSYEGKLPILYHQNPVPLGSPANWNAVLNRARGEYILLLHHDDKFADEHALATLITFLQNENADFAFGRNESIDLLAPKTAFVGSYFKRFYKSPTRLIVQNVLGAPSNVVFKKQALPRYDERFKWIVDIELYTRLFEEKKSFAYIDKTLIQTGRHEGQVTNECINNPNILVYENILYAIDHLQQLDNIQVFDFYWRLLRNTGVRQVEDLQKLGFDLNRIPRFIFIIIRYLKKSPEWAQKIGVGSKVLMTLSYFSHNIFKN
jgi:glycosyltransferase involved in cell wall biosynthesis